MLLKVSIIQSIICFPKNVILTHTYIKKGILKLNVLFLERFSFFRQRVLYQGRIQLLHILDNQPCIIWLLSATWGVLGLKICHLCLIFSRDSELGSWILINRSPCAGEIRCGHYLGRLLWSPTKFSTTGNLKATEWHS